MDHLLLYCTLHRLSIAIQGGLIIIILYLWCYHLHLTMFRIFPRTFRLSLLSRASWPQIRPDLAFWEERLYASEKNEERRN